MSEFILANRMNISTSNKSFPVFAVHPFCYQLNKELLLLKFIWETTLSNKKKTKTMLNLTYKLKYSNLRNKNFAFLRSFCGSKSPCKTERFIGFPFAY